MTITNRHKAKLSKQAEMQRLLSHREKGLQALDSPLRKGGANARARLRNRGLVRKPLQKLAKPGLGNGRLQKAIRRAFIAHDDVISTTIAMEWAYAAEMMSNKARHGFYYAARRALASIGARRIGRSKRGSGRPIMWRLVTPDVTPDGH